MRVGGGRLGREMEGAEERGWGRGEGGNDEISSVAKTNRGEERWQENGKLPPKSA